MKEIIQTDKAPKAVGPYSQAVKTGNLLFCSGQIPLDSQNGTIVPGGIKEQTRKVMENIGAVISKGGLSFDSIVKATCYLKDMNDFGEFNEVYGSFFSENPPARECVEVSRLPKDVMVEVSVICSA
ncbi:MAG: RidA family protein [Spirochaetia bacterium]